MRFSFIQKYKYIAVLIALISVLLFLYLYLNQKDDVKIDQVIQAKPVIELPLKNEAEYTQQFNESINQSEKAHKKYLEHLKTPEGKKQSDTYWNKLSTIAQGQIKQINFYALVLDQNGLPVRNMDITFNATSGFLAKGDGYQRTKTNANGLFIVKDVSGTALSMIKMVKKGYEIEINQGRNFDNFIRYPDSVLWRDFTKENPFIFRAWKVTDGEYPNTSHTQTVYGFKLGKKYSLDFTLSNKRKVKKEGDLPLDLQVEFNRDEFNWALLLKVPNGGLIETNDSYMNLAPAQGYLNQLEFTGTKKEYVVEKKFYLYSRGKFYSRLKVRIRPFSRKKSAIHIDHVLNLDGNRNLEVKKR